MALALTTAACGLYFLKPDSASGRIPIWRNTLKMIGEHMPFGAGPNSFLAEYMSCQGAYFAEHPESRYAMLADNVAHPFNEYLLLGAEYGLFAWALFGLVAYCILKAPLKKTIPLLSLTSIALFACFSYPLRYSFVIVLVAFGLSAMHSKPIVRFTLKPILKISLSILLLIELGAAWKDILFEARWKQQINAVMLGKKASALESYNQLYLTRNHNPYFLYNYGMILNDTGNYSLSYDILKECSQYLNDYDVQIGMGDICFRLKAYGKAEDHYVTASRMIPSRFAPLSRLLECYMEMQEEENAMHIAEEILRKQTKIPSTEIDEIRTKAFDYIKSR